MTKEQLERLNRFTAEEVRWKATVLADKLMEIEGDEFSLSCELVNREGLVHDHGNLMDISEEEIAVIVKGLLLMIETE